ncbi:MAG: hypothetical protein L7S62_01485, partial [Flavobacteriales bacterium]|nr:hypothetical protein [Flavobacteriales bacterium]
YEDASSTYEWGVRADSVHVWTNRMDLNGNLRVEGDSDLEGALDVDGDTQLDTTNIDGMLTVRDDADLNADLDVDGVSNLDTTDIDGSLNVQDMATFQANVQINDSLNVTNDAHIGGNFQVDLNSDLDGLLNVQMGAHLQDTLYVAGFANFDDSLDVAMSVNIQDNLDVNDSFELNTAENEGTVFSVTDSKGGTGVSIITVDVDGGASSATTLTTHRLIVQDDAVYNGDMTISGALAVTNLVTSAAVPTSPNNLTNKQYVDDAISAAVTPPVMYDYSVTNSTSDDVVYYINGDLLLYSDEEESFSNYTISLYGENMDNVTGASLRARGNANDLTDGSTAWSNTDASTSTFDIGYTDIVALAGGQTDGYVSCSLSFTTAAGTYNSGLTIRFYLDSSNEAPTAADFQDTLD